jgi:hypothetical protein
MRLHLVKRCRHPSDPLHGTRGQLAQILRTVQRTIGHHIAGQIVTAQLRQVLVHYPAKLHRVTAIAAERLHPPGDARLVLNHEFQHHLVQVGPMIPAVALGDVNDPVLWGLGAVVAAIHMKTGCIQMHIR